MNEYKIEVRPHTCPKCEGHGEIIDPAERFKLPQINQPNIQYQTKQKKNYGGDSLAQLTGGLFYSNKVTTGTSNELKIKKITCPPCKGTGIVWSPDNVKLVIEVVDEGKN